MRPHSAAFRFPFRNWSQFIFHERFTNLVGATPIYRVQRQYFHFTLYPPPPLAPQHFWALSSCRLTRAATTTIIHFIHTFFVFPPNLCMIGRIEYPCTSAVVVGVGVRVCGYSQLMVQVMSRRAESMVVESAVIVVGETTTGTAARTPAPSRNGQINTH